MEKDIYMGLIYKTNFILSIALPLCIFFLFLASFTFQTGFTCLFIIIPVFKPGSNFIPYFSFLFLKITDQLIIFTFVLSQLIIGNVTVNFFGFTFDLVPVSFYLQFVHWLFLL